MLPANVGGDGGCPRIRQQDAESTVVIIARIKTDSLTSLMSGDINSPRADPIGLAMAIIAVAVVLPFKSNQSSEYFGPRT